MLKLSKNFNFELQKSYVPQKKSENMYNKGSARKSKISCKKIYFLQFFSIFATYLRTPRIFNAQFSESSEKKFQKSFFWNLSNIKRNKVMNFGVSSPNPVETVEGYMLQWAQSAQPRQE